VSGCDREASVMRGPWPTGGCCSMWRGGGGGGGGGISVSQGGRPGNSFL